MHTAILPESIKGAVAAARSSRGIGFIPRDPVHSSQHSMSELGKANFGLLLEKAQETNRKPLNDTAPKYGINDIRRQCVDIRETTRVGDEDRSRGMLLLANKGYDVEETSNALRNTDFREQVEAVSSREYPDVETFQLNERYNVMLSTAEDAMEATLAMFRERQVETLEDDWNEMKRELLDELGHMAASQVMNNPADTSFTSPSRSTRNRVGGSNSMGASSSNLLFASPMASQQIGGHGAGTPLGGRNPVDGVNRKKRNYFQAFVQAFQDGRTPSEILETFKDVVVDDVISELWAALQCTLVNMEDDTWRTSTADRIKGSLAYLGGQFHAHIRRENNNMGARTGGRPGVLADIDGYLEAVRRSGALSVSALDISVQNETSVDYWCRLFMALRCQAPEDVILALARDLAAKSPDASGLIALLKESYRSVSGRASDAWREARSEFDRLRRRQEGAEANQEASQGGAFKGGLHSGTDDAVSPYALVVYNIVGGFDPSFNHQNVLQTIEDYVFIRLSHLLHLAPGAELDRGLIEFQREMVDYGEHHFRNSYVRLLLWSLQYKEFIQHLYRYSETVTDAVHMALVVAESGAPIVTNSGGSLDHAAHMVEKWVVQYARMLIDVGAVDEAIQYLNAKALRKLSKARHLEHVHSILMQNTDQFDTLLGVRRIDELRGPLPGAGATRLGAGASLIQKHFGESDWRHLVHMCAVSCIENGHYALGIQLFDLEGEYMAALNVLNQQLSQHLTATGSERSRLQELASVLSERYRTVAAADSVSNSTETRRVLDTFRVLCDLLRFYDLVVEGQHLAAIQALRDVNLLPASAQQVDDCARSFAVQSELVKRNVPDMLMKVMISLVRLYEAFARSGGSIDSAKQDDLQELRSQADVLVVYAGAIPWRMPGDTYAQLIQLKGMLK